MHQFQQRCNFKDLKCIVVVNITRVSWQEGIFNVSQMKTSHMLRRHPIIARQNKHGHVDKWQAVKSTGQHRSGTVVKEDVRLLDSVTFPRDLVTESLIISCDPSRRKFVQGTINGDEVGGHFICDHLELFITGFFVCLIITLMCKILLMVLVNKLI